MDVALSSCGFARETPWNDCSVLPETRHSAKRFFAKALAAFYTRTPRVITVDKNAVYPKAFKGLKAERLMPNACELQQSKYLNNLIVQDHRFIKRLVKLGMGFYSFETACRTYAADMKREVALDCLSFSLIHTAPRLRAHCDTWSFQFRQLLFKIVLNTLQVCSPCRELRDD